MKESKKVRETYLSEVLKLVNLTTAFQKAKFQMNDAQLSPFSYNYRNNDRSTTACLSICQLKDIWVVSNFW